MKIWVDADACPVAIREIIFRAADRCEVPTTLVANAFIKIPPSPNIAFRKVAQGFDIPDNAIVESVTSGDLVITGDIPLAAEVIEKGGHALSPRGEMFSVDTIKSQLTMRDFMDTMRGSGLVKPPQVENLTLVASGYDLFPSR